MRKTVSTLLILTILLGVIPNFLVQSAAAQTPDILDPMSIPKWTNELEIPPVYSPTNITDASGKLIRQ